MSPVRVLLILFAAVLAGFPAIGGALGQDRGDRVVVAQSDPPFLMRLFGFRRQEPPPPPRDGGPKIFRVVPGERLPFDPGRPARSRSGQSKPAQGSPKRIKVPTPEVVIAPKAPDARRVLVIGDELAADLTRGLDVAFADTPGVRIDGAAVEGSGVGTDEPVVWARRLGERMSGDEPPDAVVMLIGLHDVAPISVDGAPAEFRTSKWEDVYRARVRAVMVAARSRNVPLFVVGLVPMADMDLTTDLAFLDEILREEAQSAFATYVNVWNEFADETGSFAASGPDVGGQVRQLRLKSGIGFTKSGSRKLAFYVEQEIRSWVDRGAPGLMQPVTSGDGLVMSLTDPEAGPGEDLVDTAAAPAPKDGTPLYDLVVKGRPLVPVAGRVDDLAIR
jgi:hypothetical protein